MSNMDNKLLDLFRQIETLAEIYPNIINRMSAICTLYDKRLNGAYSTKRQYVIDKLSLGATTIKEIHDETLINYKEIKLIVEELINEDIVEIRYAPKQRGGQLKPGPKAKMFFIKERKDY